METSSQKGSSYEVQLKNYKLTSADLILNYLEQIGTEYVFGIPGGAIEPLYSALARSGRRGGPRPIVARHEAGAVFMADGYARETGKIGVCCATSGPGTTNMITGVASAYEDNIPLLVISGQTPLHAFGKGATQESSCTGIDTVGMFKYCTRLSTFVSHPNQLEHKLVNALITAFQPTPGPVHLSIPVDILRGSALTDRPKYNVANHMFESTMCDDQAINSLISLIKNSRNIIFVIGGDCEKAIGSILELSIILKTSLIALPQGKGLISSYHPQFRGVFGVAGHNSAVKHLSDPSVDLVVVIGSGLDEMTTNGWDEHALMTTKLVHIDAIGRHLTRSPMARLHVRGNILSVFKKLLDYYKSDNHHSPTITSRKSPEQKRRYAPVIQFERRHVDRRSTSQRPNPRRSNVESLHSKDRRHTDRRERPIIPMHPVRRFSLSDEDKFFNESSPIKPQRLMYDLARLFPPNTRYLADIGNSFLWAIHYLHPMNRRVAGYRSSNGGVLRMSMKFASMGWAIGGAVGTSIGCKGVDPVVCITGDGSLLMCGQEMTVAVAEKLPVVFVVLNDSALGTVKHGQRMAGAEEIGFEIPPIDFCAFAKSMGVQGFTIRSSQDMEMLDVQTICNNQGPTLLDVQIDPDEQPPLGERLKSLASSGK